MSELLFHGGIAACCAVVLLSIIAAAALRFYKARLYRQLDNDYGKRRR